MKILKLCSMNPCPRCGSRDMWDDATMWGCNKCGWMGSNM